MAKKRKNASATSKNAGRRVLRAYDRTKGVDRYLRNSFGVSNDITQCRRSKRLQRKHRPTWRRGDFCESESELETESESELESESTEEKSSHQTSESEASEGLGEEHLSADSKVVMGKIPKGSNETMPKKLKESNGGRRVVKDATQIEADDSLGFDKHDSESIKLDSGGYTGVLCSVCQVGAAKDFLLQCTGAGCLRAFHTFCIDHLKELETDWMCSYCKGALPNGSQLMPKKIQKIVGYRQIKVENKKIANQEQVLLKWHALSHHHDTWVPIEWIHAYNPIQFFHYRNKNPSGNEELVDHRKPEWFHIDRVISLRKKDNIAEICQILPSFQASQHQNEDFEYLTKWKGLDYCEATWESTLTEDLLVAVSNLFQRHTKTSERCNDEHLNTSVCHFDETPGYLSGMLYPYQLVGLNWLLRSFLARRNAILADEMGLGKTVQVISFIQCLKQEKLDNKPILILAPKSTLFHWEKEFRQWAPDLNAIIYQGDKASRRYIRQHELYSSEKNFLFDALITNYEMVLFDNSVLRKFEWSAVILDEGHKIKNLDCKLGKYLKSYSSNFRMLMTGTPLQNTLLELFTLLHFLDPNEFPDPEEEASSFAEIGSGRSHEESLKVSELHDILRPRMLRRMKNDALPGCIPAKKWIEIPCALTVNQRELYIDILTKNYKKLNEGIISGGKKTVLNFILIQLKKCCDHPYLFPGQEKYHQSEETVFSSMIASSGKLQLLEKLLPKLKQRGNRVLLFSQMTKMLDILEDFVFYLGLKYFRIDGQTGNSSRHQQMKEFNAPGSDIFIFLISTRAGGLGINLHTADRVIIYDPDFNPFMDLQAQSRAHRIGQLRPVVVYQLITKGTVEEKILQKSKKKLAVENLVMNYLKNKTKISDEKYLHSVILHGARKIMNSKNMQAMKICYDDAAIETLFKLDPKDDEKYTSEDNGYLDSIQSFENFGDANEEAPPPSPKANDWVEILGPIEYETEDLGRGKRQKNDVKYVSDDVDGDDSSHDDSHNDEIYSPYNSSSSDSSDSGSDLDVKKTTVTEVMVD